MANSKRKCKHCGEYVNDWVRLPVGTFCTLDHAMEWQAKKRKQDANKAYNKRTNELKRQSRDNDRSYWTKQAQAAFNAFIRQRDKGRPCISCGKPDDGKRDAGHYRSVGACPELRFEPLNCHAQCVPCNQHRSGNLIEYRIGLVAKVGLESVELLEGPHGAKKYTVQDLKQIVKTYKELIK